MSSAVWAIGSQGYGAYSYDSRFQLTPTNEIPQGFLVPGFVDIHIHGAYGIDFMSASKDEMGTLCNRLADVGYEAFLPTTITAGAHEVSRALSNLPQNPMIKGFHLEGPFISPKFPGAQPVESILAIGSEPTYWNLILNDSRLRIVTLAPELTGAKEFIEHLTEHGVIASMGHTSATYTEATSGIEAGARHVTHTYNAMPGLHHREPGVLGAALTNDEVFCEVIYDRQHISKPAMDVLLRCKGARKIIAVSDSSAATGLPGGSKFTMWGHDVETTSEAVRIVESGALAGSSVTLFDCFRNLAHDFDPELAIRACCLNPRYAMGWIEDPKVWLLLNSAFEIQEIFQLDS